MSFTGECGPVLKSGLQQEQRTKIIIHSIMIPQDHTLEQTFFNNDARIRAEYKLHIGKCSFNKVNKLLGKLTLRGLRNVQIFSICISKIKSHVKKKCIQNLKTDVILHNIKTGSDFCYRDLRKFPLLPRIITPVPENVLSLHRVQVS